MRAFKIMPMEQLKQKGPLFQRVFREGVGVFITPGALVLMDQSNRCNHSLIAELEQAGFSGYSELVFKKMAKRLRAEGLIVEWQAGKSCRLQFKLSAAVSVQIVQSGDIRISADKLADMNAYWHLLR